MGLRERTGNEDETRLETKARTTRTGEEEVFFSKRQTAKNLRNNHQWKQLFSGPFFMPRKSLGA